MAKGNIMKAVRNFRDDTDCYAVSTIKVDDRDSKQFETAIAPKLNGGRWKVVEVYEAFEESEKGHKKWFEAVTDFDAFDLDNHKEVFEDYHIDGSSVEVESNL